MMDEDILSELVASGDLGAVLAKPRLSFADAQRVNVGLDQIRRRALAQSNAARAARAIMLSKLLAAPSSRSISKHEGGVTYNDWDTQAGLWPNGATSLVLQGARDKQPWIFMGFAYTGPVGIGVTSLKLATFDSVDGSNFTTALAGATQFYDLSLCTPDSNLWLTPKSRPNFQTIPFGTIVGGTQNVTINISNVGPAAIGALTVLKWTPNPGCRKALMSFNSEITPSDPSYRKVIADLWSNPRDVRRVLDSVRAVAGYDFEDEEDAE